MALLLSTSVGRVNQKVRGYAGRVNLQGTVCGELVTPCQDP